MTSPIRVAAAAAITVLCVLFVLALAIVGSYVLIAHSQHVQDVAACTRFRNLLVATQKANTGTQHAVKASKSFSVQFVAALQQYVKSLCSG